MTAKHSWVEHVGLYAMYKWKRRKHAGSRDSWCNSTEAGSGWVVRVSWAAVHVSTLHMLLLALVTPRHYALQGWKKLSKMQAGHVTQRSNYITMFHVAGRLPVKDWQLWPIDMDNGLCSLLNACHWVTITRETVPRKTAENTVKHEVLVLVQW